MSQWSLASCLPANRIRVPSNETFASAVAAKPVTKTREAALLPTIRWAPEGKRSPPRSQASASYCGAELYTNGSLADGAWAATPTHTVDAMRATTNTTTAVNHRTKRVLLRRTFDLRPDEGSSTDQGPPSSL